MVMGAETDYVLVRESLAVPAVFAGISDRHSRTVYRYVRRCSCIRDSAVILLATPALAASLGLQLRSHA